MSSDVETTPPNTPKTTNLRSKANKPKRPKTRQAAIEEEEQEIGRGITVMYDVVRHRALGKKYPLQWNVKGQMIGQNKKKYISFLGVVVRQRVPITVRDWRSYSPEIKDAIWAEMTETFELDLWYRKKLLSTAGTYARSFRNNLVLIYMKDDQRNWIADPPQEPPVNYPQITQEQWTEFVKYCYSEEYQELSVKNREKAKSQTTIYVGGRKGYAGVEEELLEARKKDLPPGAPIPDRIPRHELFLHCRQMPDGSYESEKWPALKEYADRIELLKQRQAQGDYIPAEDGPHDILAQALNKPEHPGRLRGLGFGVSKKDYFHNDKYCGIQEMQQMRSEMVMMRQELAELKSQRTQQSQYSQPTQFHQSAHVHQSTHFHQSPQFTQSPNFHQPPFFPHSPPQFPSPHHTPYGPPQPIPEGISTCDLALIEPWYRIVARGKVFNDNNPIHNRPVPQGWVKVGPEIVNESEIHTRLPMPDEDGELYVLQHSIGARILWPRDLVVNAQVDINAPKKGKQPATSQQKRGCSPTPSSNLSRKERVPRSLKDLFVATRARLAGTGELISVDMPDGLFGATPPEMIGMEEIRHVVKQKEIGASIISTYIRCVLYDPNRPIYRFISPYRVGPASMIPPIEQSQHLSDRFMSGLQHNDMMWFIPYNAGHHWVLLAVKPFEQTVFYLDPLQADRNTRSQMTEIVNRAITIYKGQMTRSRRPNTVTWVDVQAPLQLNDIDCGYYMLRYMREIMQHNATTIPLTYFAGSNDAYLQEEIDEIRCEWADAIMDCFGKQYASFMSDDDSSS